MKAVMAILFCVAGILLGLYVGIWLCFIGGIVQIVEAAKANPVSSWGIAFGITRIIIASPVGWIICVIGLALGRVCAE